MKDGKQLVVKDTWADVQWQYKEREFLDACTLHQIKNVLKLHLMKDMAMNSKPDSTLSCQPLALQKDIEDQAHQQLLLDPLCMTIQYFRSQKELLQAFIDCIKGMFQIVSKSCAAADIFDYYSTRGIS